ncbi:MAG: glycoside hydrolase family 16 protein [Spirosomataceae bacterium]
MTKSSFATILGLISVSLLCVFCQSTPDATGAQPSSTTTVPFTPVVYDFETTPTWSDEFDYTGLPDAKKWGYDVGGNGWGNNEKQYYTKDRQENARVEGGKLIIEARKESFGSNAYTSARLVTKNKADWTYGRFVIRAKLPQGVGSWPAIWMLATDQSYSDTYWPDNGEIDIMEHVGFDQGRVHFSIHCKAYNHIIGTQRTANMMVNDASQAFHDYRLDWTPEKIVGYIDDQKYFEFANQKLSWKEWPFDKKFHLLLNIAVGGNWGGQKGIDDSIFPQRMEVEYVRVYKVK